MVQHSDAGHRPMKTLLVASLIASQIVTNVVAFPVPSHSQSNDDDTEHEEHSKIVDKALKLNRCARNPIDCVEDASLSGVEHLSTTLSHGIVAGSDKITKIGHRVEDRVGSIKDVKNALVHGEAPEDDDHWHSYAKRDYALLSQEAPYYHLNHGTASHEHIFRQHNMDSDLLNPNDITEKEESENGLAKRASAPPKVTGKSVALAAVVLGTASAGLLGGTLYAGNLVAKGVGKGVNDLRHHHHDDDDDDDDEDDNRRHHRDRRSPLVDNETEDEALVKRGWGKNKTKVRRPTPPPEYVVSKKTMVGLHTAKVVGLTAAAAGGAALIYHKVHDKDDDHHHRRDLMSSNGEILSKRSPQTLTEVPADTPADLSSKDLKNKKPKKTKKVKKTSSALKVVKPKKVGMTKTRKTALAAGVIGMVGAGGYLANKIMSRHGDAQDKVPLDSKPALDIEDKSVVKRGLTRKTGAIKPYQPTIITTKAKTGMGMKGKMAIGAGAGLAIAGIYKGVQHFRHSNKPKGDDDEKLTKRGATNPHEVSPMHALHAFKTEHLGQYEHLGEKYSEHQEGKARAQTPEEIRDSVNRRNQAGPGGYKPIMDQSVHALKTEEYERYKNLMNKHSTAPKDQAKVNEVESSIVKEEASTSPAQLQATPREDPIVSRIKEEQRLQEQKRLEKGKAALEKLRREGEDPYVRQMREIQEEQERNSKNGKQA